MLCLIECHCPLHHCNMLLTEKRNLNPSWKKLLALFLSYLFYTLTPSALSFLTILPCIYIMHWWNILLRFLLEIIRHLGSSPLMSASKTLPNGSSFLEMTSGLMWSYLLYNAMKSFLHFPKEEATNGLCTPLFPTSHRHLKWGCRQKHCLLVHF